MAARTDAVTTWWRRISLRAKVTGVTVAMIAIGLFVAGVGTSFVLYSALLTNVDETVRQLVQTEDVAKRLLEVSEDEEGVGRDHAQRRGAPHELLRRAVRAGRRVHRLLRRHR